MVAVVIVEGQLRVEIFLGPSKWQVLAGIGRQQQQFRWPAECLAAAEMVSQLPPLLLPSAAEAAVVHLLGRVL